MERLNILSPVRKTYESGAVVEAKRVDVTKRPEPGKVARHEAAHVIAAGEIVSATIIPSGNARGITQPVKMTAATAAAAEALGYDGTGWDMYLTKHILNTDPNVAKSAARAAMSGKDEEMQEVATLLEERKTIGQKDVEEAVRSVDNRRKGIHPVEVQITSPEGKTQVIADLSFRGEIKIQDKLLIPAKTPNPRF